MGRLILITLFLLGTPSCAGAVDPAKLEELTLPPNFSIEIYAHVPGARSLVVVPELEAVIVGTRGNRVYAVQDKGLKGKPETVSVLAAGLKVPNGIAWKNGHLYIAEQHQISRYSILKNAKLKIGKSQTLVTDLPDDSWHGWRYAAFGPDGKLYVAIGAPCNVCRVKGKEATIIQVDPVSGENKIYAHGVRNSVGLAFHPVTGKLYFTDNGSDGLGDDIPPDELNIASKLGQHFGFPWFGGGSTPTDEFPDKTPPMKTIPPVVAFQAHTASLGIHFYQGKQFPKTYYGSAFVAQHGSWNRSIPTGYRIMHLKMDSQGNVLNKEIFAQGWLQKNGKWGRPVDIKQLPDSSLLISDDYAGVIYRISYKTP
ncbi:MAG: PQQ-dependent sugar dehydrogenase [Alphaproteobacteria bacterium]|nr:PQQ-dependent sugar dehydrogenase [Alphaproteobacteria bacterium]